MTKNFRINRAIKINEVVKVKAPIVEALQKAVDNPSYQFHIPGHTKGRAVFSDFKKLIGEKALNVDTTDEFDNLGTLHPATGPIGEAQELAAQTFGAAKTFFLQTFLPLPTPVFYLKLRNKTPKILLKSIPVQ